VIVGTITTCCPLPALKLTVNTTLEPTLNTLFVVVKDNENNFDKMGVLVKTFLDKKEEETVVYLLMSHSSAFRDSKILSLERKGKELNIGVDIPEASGIFSVQKFLYKIEIKEKINQISVKEVKNKKIGNFLIYKYEYSSFNKEQGSKIIPKNATLVESEGKKVDNTAAYLVEENGKSILYLSSRSYLKVLSVNKDRSNLKIKTIINEQENNTKYFYSKLTFPGKIENIEIEETKE
jgi:hypothetical protein